MEENGKLVYEKSMANKKGLREVECQRVWVGGALLGANLELDAHYNKLDQAYQTIRDLRKTVERYNAMKKEVRENYEAQILELRTTLKEFNDLLAKEQVGREKVHRSFLSKKFYLGLACEEIKNMKM